MGLQKLQLEVWRHRLASIPEEMGETLRRTSFSPNIKERLDFSCALFDAAGRMVAQAAHIPAHLGAMPASVATVLPLFRDWQEGDVAIVNDPFQGGNHLPDITMISPVFLAAEETPPYFVASRAHHADVGGMAPGSLPLSTEIFQEGIIIPPVKLYRRGVLNQDLLDLILRNVRTPRERRGDINAQLGAHHTGARRLQELCMRFSLSELRLYSAGVLAHSEEIMRSTIRRWADGSYVFCDVLEWPQGDTTRSIPLQVTLTVSADTLDLDFTGTAACMTGSLNTVIAVTQSACYYVAVSLLQEEIMVNSGCFAPISVRAPAASVVNATHPHAVAGGNVETSQRIVDLVLGAAAQAWPDRIPAASQGTMNNLTMGGFQPDGTLWAYYETMGGGMGGGPDRDGLDAVQVHMTNTRNTPVEALELDFPFEITKYAVRPGSGGAGRYRGGHGLVREFRFHDTATVSMLSERRHAAPWGLQGGAPGQRGENRLHRTNGQTIPLPGKFTIVCRRGDILHIATPGGGGWGKAAHPHGQDATENAAGTKLRQDGRPPPRTAAP